MALAPPRTINGANFNDMFTLRGWNNNKGRLFRIWSLWEAEGRSFFVAEGFLYGIWILFFWRSSFKKLYKNSKIRRPIFPNIFSIKQQHLQHFLHLAHAQPKTKCFLSYFKKRLKKLEIKGKKYLDYSIMKLFVKFCSSRGNIGVDIIYDVAT